MADALNLGTSLAFPPRPDGKGGLATVSGIEAVENHMEAIISSKKGEHVMRPSLGVDSVAFKPGTPHEVVARCIREAIIDAPEDRIDPTSLSIQVRDIVEDPHRLAVVMTYTLKGDSTPRSYETNFELDSVSETRSALMDK